MRVRLGWLMLVVCTLALAAPAPVLADGGTEGCQKVVDRLAAGGSPEQLARAAGTEDLGRCLEPAAAGLTPRTVIPGPQYEYPDLNCTLNLAYGNGVAYPFGYLLLRGQSITGVGLSGVITGSYWVAGLFPGIGGAPGFFGGVAVLTRPRYDVRLVAITARDPDPFPPSPEPDALLIGIFRPTDLIRLSVPWMVADCERV